MYHDKAQMPLPEHTMAVLAVLDKALPPGYKQERKEGYTHYSAIGADGSGITVRHEPTMRGDVMVFLYKRSIGIKTAARLLDGLRQRDLEVERGHATEDGNIYLLHQSSKSLERDLNPRPRPYQGRALPG